MNRQVVGCGLRTRRFSIPGSGRDIFLEKRRNQKWIDCDIVSI